MPWSSAIGWNDKGWSRPAAGAAGGFSIAWQDVKVQDGALGTTITFSTVQFGATDANRVVAIPMVIRLTGATGWSITGVTIGGVTASVVAGSTTTNVNNTISSIWYATGVSGTSGAVVITLSTSAADMRVGIESYRVVTTTSTPTGAQNYTPTSTTTSASITIPSGGGAIGFASNNGATGVTAVSITGTGMNKDTSSQFLQTAAGHPTCGASGIDLTAGTPTITSSVDSGANVQMISLAAWSP